MRRLILRAEAENDIAQAHNRARLQSPQRAQALLDAVEEGLCLIEEGPRLYAVRENHLRRINLKGACYALLFRFYESGEVVGTLDEVVTVIGLMHQIEDLNRFATRLEFEP